MTKVLILVVVVVPTVLGRWLVLLPAGSAPTARQIPWLWVRVQTIFLVSRLGAKPVGVDCTLNLGRS